VRAVNEDRAPVAGLRTARFTRAGVEAGALAILPLLPTLAVFGVGFGMLAATTGLSLAEALIFSAWVFAGSAQMATLNAWADPVPYAVVVVTTLGMNARYLLLSATLRPWLHGLPAHQVGSSLFLLGDSNWALAMKERERGLDDAGFLVGSGATTWVAWVLSTGAGHAFGRVIASPERFGIDFILGAFFASMAAAFVRRVTNLVPFGVAAIVAIAFDRFVPGPWSLAVGALAGSAAAALKPAHAR
jgi:predicted branched-subunit amino acid permease